MGELVIPCDQNGLEISALNPFPVTIEGGGSISVGEITAVSGGFVDGAIATLGLEANAANTNPATAGTAMSFLKGLLTVLNAGVNVTVLGSILQQIKTQANAVAGVVTFSANITYLNIYNTDSTNAGTFTVNGIAIPVPAGASWQGGVGGTPGTTVTITGSTTSYVLSRFT
jgi:hypothetical protein